MAATRQLCYIYASTSDDASVPARDLGDCVYRVRGHTLPAFQAEVIPGPLQNLVDVRYHGPSCCGRGIDAGLSRCPLGYAWQGVQCPNAPAYAAGAVALAAEPGLVVLVDATPCVEALLAALKGHPVPTAAGPAGTDAGEARPTSMDPPIPTLPKAAVSADALPLHLSPENARAWLESHRAVNL
jgi:hypothetical protein